tara:strand:- start:81 stop:920 length:840 start_codon:yes stop_codon:yes gene_type:complete
MIRSYAKLNLFLRVVKKLKNGFHNIQTNSVLIDLHDEINIKSIFGPKDIINFNGKFKKNIKKNKNTVIQILLLLRQNGLIKKDKKFKITIKKKIPVFSGLGGGTSNAIYILKYFIKKKLNDKLLKKIEKKIGTDSRLFIFKNSIQEDLFKVRENKQNLKMYFILFHPKFKCSTKEIYKKNRQFRKKINLSSLTFKSARYYVNFLKKEANDLQQVVIKKNKKIKNVLNLISKQQNCQFSRITGSGSICYGMFSNRKSAILGMKIIKKKFPSNWCVITKTI